MSIARGVLKGFLKESLDQKARRDEMYADTIMEAGRDFRKTSALFREEEKNIEKRYGLVVAKHGTNAGLYASYNGLLDTDAGTQLVLNELEKNTNLKKQINDFDFQGYGFNTEKSQRFMDFKDQQKDVINLITKNQGSGPVAELYLKDLKPADTQITDRPDLDLPAMSDVQAPQTTDPNNMRLLRSNGFTEFTGLERDQNTKRFKKSFEEGYDSKIHGPSKDLYAFEKFFNNYYLPAVTGQNTQMSNMGFNNQNLTNDRRVELAQLAINQAKAMNDNEAVENIKEQLRTDLGVTNLSELIK